MSQTDALLAQYAATRDPVVRRQLILDHQNLIRYAASRFVGQSETTEDLIQVGNIGLINALDRYDPTQNVRFITYALATIFGEIKRHFRDKTWHVKVPRRLQERTLRARKANHTLSAHLGRPPTVREVAEAIGVTEEEALEALEIGQVTWVTSLDGPAHGQDGDGGSLFERIGGLDPALSDLETHADLRWAIDCLEDGERQVVRQRFFEEMSQTQIAQGMGVSQMHVSRMERRALHHLRTLLHESSGVRAPTTLK